MRQMIEISLTMRLRIYKTFVKVCEDPQSHSECCEQQQKCHNRYQGVRSDGSETYYKMTH